MRIQHDPFPKIPARDASAICARLELSAPARSLLVDELSPQGFLAVLVQNEHWTDAVRFLAFALPRREAVWWACVVCRSIPSASDPRSEACLSLAEGWVFEPSDAKGRLCFEAAEAQGFAGAPAYAALGAFWAGPSLAPEGQPPVEPDPSLCPTGASASVLLAVAGGDPARAPELYALAVEAAVDIANGGNGRPPAARGERR